MSLFVFESAHICGSRMYFGVLGTSLVEAREYIKTIRATGRDWNADPKSLVVRVDYADRTKRVVLFRQNGQFDLAFEQEVARREELII